MNIEQAKKKLDEFLVENGIELCIRGACGDNPQTNYTMLMLVHNKEVIKLSTSKEFFPRDIDYTGKAKGE